MFPFDVTQRRNGQVVDCLQSLHDDETNHKVLIVHRIQVVAMHSSYVRALFCHYIRIPIEFSTIYLLTCTERNTHVAII